MNTERYIGFDLETTGLNPQVDSVLEAACCILDTDFNVIAQKQTVLGFNYNPKLHTGLSPRVVQMHTDSGLWDACRAAPLGWNSSERQQIWLEFERFIVENGAQDAPLFGANPEFDRRLLTQKAPNVESLLHYRNFDVNTLYLLEGSKEKQHRPHRAIADLYQDIRTAQLWKSLFAEFQGAL